MIYNPEITKYPYPDANLTTVDIFAKHYNNLSELEKTIYRIDLFQPDDDESSQP